MAAPPVHDEDLVLSYFPDPPPYYRHFTTENLERLKELEKQAALETTEENNKGAGPPKLSADQILALPVELRYLIPPSPPADDEEFHVFGEATKAKPTDAFLKNMAFISSRFKAEDVLQDWKYEQLYPSSSAQDSGAVVTAAASVDRQSYLFRFLRSILLSYIALLGIVALDPVSSAKDDKVADILTLVTNMHALINEYRPHQARETLIAKMEEQVQRKRNEVEGVKKIGERVRAVLASFGTEVPASDGWKQGERDVKTGLLGRATEDDRRRASQRQMWKSMDELLG